MLGVTGRGVGRLYEAVAGGAPPSLEELVPESAEAEGVLIYEGRNSLAAFSRFQKRFARETGSWSATTTSRCRSSRGRATSWCTRRAAAASTARSSTSTTPSPRRRAGERAGWPAYTPNERGLSRFVYGGMHDYVRRVARGVVVGKAYRHGAAQGAYFSLTLPG